MGREEKMSSTRFVPAWRTGQPMWQRLLPCLLHSTWIHSVSMNVLAMVFAHTLASCVIWVWSFMFSNTYIRSSMVLVSNCAGYWLDFWFQGRWPRVYQGHHRVVLAFCVVLALFVAVSVGWMDEGNWQRGLAIRWACQEDWIWYFFILVSVVIFLASNTYMAGVCRPFSGWAGLERRSRWCSTPLS